MSVVINTNYAATVASNNLASSSSMLQKSLNRLSSGSKIVNPSVQAGPATSDHSWPLIRNSFPFPRPPA